MLKNNSCNFCLKFFSQKSSLNRHLKKNQCKGMKFNINKFISKYEKKINNFEKEIKKIKNLEKENKEMRQQIKLLNNIINPNIINSSLNNCDLSINKKITTNNITINIYGQETLDYKDKVLHKKLKELNGANEILNYLIHYIHIKNPKNRNIYLIKDKVFLNEEKLFVKRLEGWKEEESWNNFYYEEFLKKIRGHLSNISDEVINDDTLLSKELNNTYDDLAYSFHREKFKKNSKEYLNNMRELIREVKENN